MKKSTKVLLIAALCTFIAGGGFCIAGMCLGFTINQFCETVESGQMQLVRSSLEQKKEQKSDRTESISKDAQYSQTFKNIEELELYLSVSECSIVMWQKDEIQVCGELLPEGFSCVQKGKTLLIDCEKEKWNLWSETGTAQLTLYLPAETCFKNVQLNTGIGTLEVEEGYLKCQELELDSGVGQCSIQADVTKRILIDAGVGEVTLHLKGMENDFNYELDNGVGEVVIGETKLEKLGEDRWIDHNASKEVEIENGIGNILVTFSEENRQKGASDL